MKKTLLATSVVASLVLVLLLASNYLIKSFADTDIDGCMDDVTIEINDMYKKNSNGEAVKTEDSHVKQSTTETQAHITLANVCEYMGTIAEKNDDIKLMSVPVYSEEKLIYYNENIYLSRSSSFMRFLNSCPGNAANLMKNFPSLAVRDNSDGQRYVVYDTDTGYRVYIYIDDCFVVGFPIIIKDQLSSSNFKNIQVGGCFDDVLAVDSVMELYKPMVEAMTPEIIAHRSNANVFTTVHYLTDGLLTIQYGEMTEEGKLLITDIRLYPDYTVTNGYETIDYKINPLDLPE